MYVKNQTKSVDSLNVHASANAIKEIVDQVLNNPNSLIMTINSLANEPSFTCIHADTDCSAVADSSFDFLIDASGRVVVQSADPNDGLTFSGEYCDTFSLTEGTEGCPFRIQLTWTATCSGPPCIDPPITINVQMLHSVKGSTPINLGSLFSDPFILGNPVAGMPPPGGSLSPDPLWIQGAACFRPGDCGSGAVCPGNNIGLCNDEIGQVCAPTTGFNDYCTWSNAGTGCTGAFVVRCQ